MGGALEPAGPQRAARDGPAAARDEPEPVDAARQPTGAEAQAVRAPARQDAAAEGPDGLAAPRHAQPRRATPRKPEQDPLRAARAAAERGARQLVGGEQAAGVTALEGRRAVQTPTRAAQRHAPSLTPTAEAHEQVAVAHAPAGPVRAPVPGEGAAAVPEARDEPLPDDPAPDRGLEDVDLDAARAAAAEAQVGAATAPAHGGGADREPRAARRERVLRGGRAARRGRAARGAVARARRR